MEACGSAHHWARWLNALGIRVAQLERELSAVARASGACTRLLTIPGVGLLTATAMVADTSGGLV